ncbi:MAG TPA: DUF4013 domain-containing protein [Candidatus Dormibacteraeota bacterium]|nr:DUF4013 domain-containing protein [Candidatus Dormibacteraeota bacterium]
MDRVTEAFTWPLRDPDWLRKLLIIALTLVIPIIGSINGIGWMLASLDRLRAGEERLAPANLSYLGRGIHLFVVELIYGLAIVGIALVIYIPAIALAIREGRGSADPGLITVSVLLYLLAFGVTTAFSLALNFALSAVVLATDSGGISGGLELGAVIRRCRLNLTNTLIAGLMLIAASFVGSLGIYVCVIGVFFSSAYALAMQAWIVRSFEMGSRAAPAA